MARPMSSLRRRWIMGTGLLLLACAAYWVIDGEWDNVPPSLRRRKLPYAKHGQPAQSIHEDLHVIYSYWFTQ